MQNELVGWVEALSADTHRIQFSARYPLMGFVSLNPSYMLTPQLLLVRDKLHSAHRGGRAGLNTELLKNMLQVLLHCAGA